MSENTIHPHLKVESGNPTTEELAVVVAVLQAAAGRAASQGAATAAKRVANWHRNPGVLRGNLTIGHGQWVASARRGLN
jgi:hypothetical protein